MKYFTLLKIAICVVAICCVMQMTEASRVDQKRFSERGRDKYDIMDNPAFWYYA
ncbi:hypothetical protein A3Q56_03894 [Intoshia linei]|uniref:Uncharacterized protein n=1 Tax=Intoshia linei TaxID=1819745 RepID=A0A177B254_9BILA|nr:hypothetical protein A3Q56_03894 [Intoshia linei]